MSWDNLVLNGEDQAKRLCSILSRPELYKQAVLSLRSTIQHLHSRDKFAADLVRYPFSLVATLPDGDPNHLQEQCGYALDSDLTQWRLELNTNLVSSNLSYNPFVEFGQARKVNALYLTSERTYFDIDERRNWLMPGTKLQELDTTNIFGGVDRAFYNQAPQVQRSGWMRQGPAIMVYGVQGVQGPYGSKDDIETNAPSVIVEYYGKQTILTNANSGGSERCSWILAGYTDLCIYQGIVQLAQDIGNADMARSYVQSAQNLLNDFLVENILQEA